MSPEKGLLLVTEILPPASTCLVKPGGNEEVAEIFSHGRKSLEHFHHVRLLHTSENEIRSSAGHANEDIR